VGVAVPIASRPLVRDLGGAPGGQAKASARARIFSGGSIDGSARREVQPCGSTSPCVQRSEAIRPFEPVAGRVDTAFDRGDFGRDVHPANPLMSLALTFDLAPRPVGSEQVLVRSASNGGGMLLICVVFESTA